MINEKRYRELIQQLATGGITGNKTYHQYHDQFVPMDSESMGYMNGGGIGTMMQPRQNFARGGGADYIGLNPNDTSIQVEDLTETDNNGNFLISAAEALPDQTGTISSMPSITNRDLRTIEGSLIDGDDPSSRYAVQQDFKSDRPFDRDFSSFDEARMGNSNQIPDRNRGQIIERNPSAPFNRATINEIAGPSTIDRFSNTVGPVPNVEAVYQDKIMGGLEGDPNPYNFSQNFDQSYDASSDKNVPGMGIREINFIDAPADGIFTKNNIAKGLIDKNITNRAFNKGTPEATAEFLAANGFPIPENLKQFLEVDTTTGKYVSKKSPNNFMTFMSNIPTPLNLARKTFSALGNANSAFNKKMRGIDPATGLANTQAQYEAERAARQTQNRTDKMIDRINEGKSFRSNPRDAGTTKAQKDAISASLRESRRGNQYSNDSPGSGGGGKSIVCTAMYQTTGLQDWAKAMKVWYIYQKRHLSDAHQEGYHLLFKPFVKGMHKSKIIKAIGAHVAKHRTQELKHIMFNSKSDTLGKIYNNILEPICYLAGKIKSIFKK